jgi:murein DD-endopeptidase MepM/ murein hydrolase activator NlpD
MLGKSYTVIIVSRARSKVRSLYLSHRFVSYSLVALAIFFAASIATIVRLYPQAHRASTFEAENARLKADLENSQMLTQKLTKKLSTLTSLSNRLKVMAGLPSKKKKGLGPGVGGFSSQTRSMDPAKLQELHDRAEALEQKLAWLSGYFRDRNLTPSILPTQGFVSSSFGMRSNPFTNRPDFHEGIDITNKPGTPVIAPATGTVIFAGYRGTIGQSIELQHDRRISTLYGHLSHILVKTGQRVYRGEVIGLIGNTGMSTGPHLHYEIRVEKQPVNPKTYLDSFSS